MPFVFHPQVYKINISTYFKIKITYITIKLYKIYTLSLSKNHSIFYYFHNQIQWFIFSSSVHFSTPLVFCLLFASVTHTGQVHVYCMFWNILSLTMAKSQIMKWNKDNRFQVIFKLFPSSMFSDPLLWGTLL